MSDFWKLMIGILIVAWTTFGIIEIGSRYHYDREVDCLSRGQVLTLNGGSIQCGVTPTKDQ